MKLFVISHAYEGDGASQMLLAAATHWTHTLGWQVDAVAAPAMTDRAREAVAASGMRLVQRAQFDEKYDFALINCLKNIPFVQFIYPHVPIALWAHEADTVLRSPLTRQQWKDYFTKTGLVIFQTEWQRHLFSPYMPQGKAPHIALLPNGVPPIDPSPQHLPGGEFRIATLGKWTPLKGQEDLVQALSRLTERPLQCAFIGDTEYLPASDVRTRQLLAQQPQRYQLRGFLPRTQAMQEVARADLFCFPSHSESFGLAPLEAAALGVPVVLADLPPYRSIGWKHETNCLTYSPGNRRQLAQRIVRMMDDTALRAKLVEGGKELANHYRMATCVEKLSNLLSEFVGNANLGFV